MLEELEFEASYLCCIKGHECDRLTTSNNTAPSLRYQRIVAASYHLSAPSLRGGYSVELARPDEARWQTCNQKTLNSRGSDGNRLCQDESVDVENGVVWCSC